MKFEKQFREDNPQTVGETDKHFDLDNYKDWLDNQHENILEQRDKLVEALQNTTIMYKQHCDKPSVRLILENEQLIQKLQ